MRRLIELSKSDRSLAQGWFEAGGERDRVRSSSRSDCAGHHRGHYNRRHEPQGRVPIDFVVRFTANGCCRPAGLFLPDRTQLLYGVSMSNLTRSLASVAHWLRIGSKRGVSAIEYGLLAALIALVIIAAITTVGTNLQGVYQSISAQVRSYRPLTGLDQPLGTRVAIARVPQRGVRGSFHLERRACDKGKEDHERFVNPGPSLDGKPPGAGRKCGRGPAGADRTRRVCDPYRALRPGNGLEVRRRAALALGFWPPFACFLSSAFSPITMRLAAATLSSSRRPAFSSRRIASLFS